ncbi:DUF4265 domain-containing protein [Streptomyces roseolus]|uniref:DUF4265 domain-containing protein n=1 Tax=Streptomyces roseolus TaxID=67358 RepID=UPI0016765E6A|nr:DUF4265 domain-containing protein [Streptomyces roseolus]GGR48600.1 hypothetical protein GCM10010282_46720 [Streptomyces roseolus]
MPDTRDGTDGDGFTGIRLRVESQQGATADEVVAVTPMSDGHYLVRLSPGFFRGIAAGDVIAYDERAKNAEVVARGGNVAVQVFHSGIPAEAVASLKRRAVGVGGRVDGELETLVVLTFPIEIGFPTIESVLAELPDEGVEWEYGNVFDEQGEPLSWWVGIA